MQASTWQQTILGVKKMSPFLAMRCASQQYCVFQCCAILSCTGAAGLLNLLVLLWHHQLLFHDSAPNLDEKRQTTSGSAITACVTMGALLQVNVTSTSTAAAVITTASFGKI